MSVADSSINVDAISTDIYSCKKNSEGKLGFLLGYPVDINFVLCLEIGI